MVRRIRFLHFAGIVLFLAGSPAAAQVPSLGPEAAARHYGLARRADSLYHAGNWVEAESLYEHVVRETPLDGTRVYRLGRVREQQGEVRGAIEAYREAVDLGYAANAGTAYRIARLYARMGATDSAVAWLDRALAWRFEERPTLASDSSLTVLRDDARFRRIAAIPPAPPASRVEGWRSDIDYLVEEARRMHAGPARPAFSTAFDSAALVLKKRVPQLSDAQVLLGVQRLVVMLGDGHSGVYGPMPDSPLQLGGGMLPLEMRRFADGLFVINASDEATRWIGARVVRIGDVAAEDLVSGLTPYINHDTPMTVLWLGEHHVLPSLSYLAAVGSVPEGADAATVTLRTPDGVERMATVEGVAGQPRFDRKLHAPPGLARVPLFLRRVDDNYWLQPLPRHGALYFQFNQVRDAEQGPSIADFADSLRRALIRSDAQTLVVDVRHNNGGNNSLVRPLIRTMVWWEMQDPAHRIFVITGRGTFSAAQNFINRVERMTDAIFVGEPSSSSPNFTGEETNLTLPWSRVRGSISTRYWQDSNPDDTRPFIWPDVPVGMTSEDYFQGRDPALEAIWRIVGG